MEKKSRELVMAKLYFKNKDYKLAERSFIEYVRMSPNDVTALKLLAQVYEQIKRFDKAYEMYERCYLAEPERTGVLLDICRILLMNEIRLENVDYRRWLNLAMKAFPSNPIVVNFKTFLSTSPPEEVAPPKETPRVSSDGTLKVLASIEQRLENLERLISSLDSKIDNISLNNGLPKSHPMIQAKEQDPKPAEGFLGFNKSHESKQESVPDLKQPVSNFGLMTTPPNQTNLFANAVKKFDPPAEASWGFKKSDEPDQKAEKGAEHDTKPDAGTDLKQPVFNFGLMTTPPNQTNLFANAVKKLDTPAEASWGFKKSDEPDQKAEKGTEHDTKTEAGTDLKQPVSSFGLMTTPPAPTNLFADAIKKLNSPAEGSWGFKKSDEADQKAEKGTEHDTKPDAGSFLKQPVFNFGLMTTPPNQTNLFADAIKKLNLPAEGSWGFKKPDEADQEAEQEAEHETEPEAEPEPEPEPEENTCDMEPVVLKTGEEDEDILFEQRCKLHRFKDKEFKERGLGPIKVLRHRMTGKGRLIMRREAIGLVCLNCWDLKKIERVRDTQIRFIAIDASDGEPTANVFLVRFKTPELTDTFLSHLNALFNEDVELIDPKLDPKLVDKARKFQLPDLFYHKLKNQEECSGCDGCEKDA